MKLRLFELREYNDLYQKDIAKILGVERQTYASWELQNAIIPLKRLNILSNYYDVSINYLIGLTKNEKEENYLKIEELNKKEIGLRIKEIRADQKLTLRDLAKELNTTSSTISAYETGKTLILTAFAYTICQKYNYSIDWLCGKTTKKWIK